MAGTEVGVKEPTATFSACFGSAFLMLHPYKCAQSKGQRRLGTLTFRSSSFGVGRGRGRGRTSSSGFSASCVPLLGSLAGPHVYQLHLTPDTSVNPRMNWAHPSLRRYATMLAEKMAKHGTTAWLVNTGWTGGK